MTRPLGHIIWLQKYQIIILELTLFIYYLTWRDLFSETLFFKGAQKTRKQGRLLCKPETPGVNRFFESSTRDLRLNDPSEGRTWCEVGKDRYQSAYRQIIPRLLSFQNKNRNCCRMPDVNRKQTHVFPMHQKREELFTGISFLKTRKVIYINIRYQNNTNAVYPRLIFRFESKLPV